MPGGVGFSGNLEIVMMAYVELRVLVGPAGRITWVHSPEYRGLPWSTRRRLDPSRSPSAIYTIVYAKIRFPSTQLLTAHASIMAASSGRQGALAKGDGRFPRNNCPHRAVIGIFTAALACPFSNVQPLPNCQASRSDSRTRRDTGNSSRRVPDITCGGHRRRSDLPRDTSPKVLGIRAGRATFA